MGGCLQSGADGLYNIRFARTVLGIGTVLFRKIAFRKRLRRPRISSPESHGDSGRVTLMYRFFTFSSSASARNNYVDGS